MNLQGNRFSNEVRGYSEQAVAVINQPDQVVWEIWDHDGHELGLAFQDYREGIEVGAIREAQTIAQIAEQSGLPLDVLNATFEDADVCIQGRRVRRQETTGGGTGTGPTPNQERDLSRPIISHGSQVRCSTPGQGAYGGQR